MGHILVDTSVWIDYFLGRETAASLILDKLIEAGEDIVIPDLVYCEILQGCRAESDFRRMEKELSNFDIVEVGGVESARKSALNFRRLRSSGKTIRNTIDCLIATYAIEHDHFLLHDDKDFDPFEELLDLKVIR